MSEMSDSGDILDKSGAVIGRWERDGAKVRIVEIFTPKPLGVGAYCLTLPASVDASRETTP